MLLVALRPVGAPHATTRCSTSRFFKNPRFTAASGSITLVFFAMFGSIFVLTQYLQFVLGYSPLETGIRMLPFAATMMVVAPSSARIVERIGTKATVTTGMVFVTVGLGLDDSNTLYCTVPSLNLVLLKHEGQADRAGQEHEDLRDGRRVSVRFPGIARRHG